MPEIQEMKVTVVKIVPEIQEEKKEEDAVDVPKESDDSVEIKQNEELSTLDRYEFKDEEEEIYLPEWKAERHVDEEWKPKSEEKRGRPRKNQNKDKVETKKETPKEKKEVKKGKMTMAERKYMGQIPPQMAEMEPPSKKLKEEEVMEKVEVKEIEVNGDDTEEDNETEKKKVKKKTKKKETLDSDSSDMDHKKVVGGVFSNAPVAVSVCWEISIVLLSALIWVSLDITEKEQATSDKIGRLSVSHFSLVTLESSSDINDLFSRSSESFNLFFDFVTGLFGVLVSFFKTFL
jgi:hypothetical protein